MVTYCDIYEAFCKYAASQKQEDWNRLWFLCEERMSALVKTKAKRLSVPLDAMDLMDLIRDSTVLVLQRLKSAPDVTIPGFISKTFWFEFKHAYTAFNRSAKRWQRMSKVAAMLNSTR